MRPILLFLRDTITGGVLFLLPVILISMLLRKAHDYLSHIVQPIADVLPDVFFGFDGSRALAIVLMVSICFFSGLLFRSSWIKNNLGKIEDNFLSFLPGYALIKSVTADAMGHENLNGLIPVWIKDEEYNES